MGFTRTGVTVRALAFAGLVALIAASSACAETESVDQSAERQTPAEFAAELYEYGSGGDWDSVRPLLAEPFDDYGDEQLRNGLAFARWPGGLSDPEQWQVEEQQDFTVARSADDPQQALVLKPDDENSWRYDPGDRAMMLIEHRSAGIDTSGLPRETNGMSEDAAYQSTIKADARSSDVHQHFQRQLGPIIPEEETIAITLHMTLQGAEEVRLPLAGIVARTGEGSTLDTHLTGSTAIIEDGIARMPIPEGARAAYRLSLSIDQPVKAETFELTFQDLEIVEPTQADGNALEFDLHYDAVPATTLPAYLEE